MRKRLGDTAQPILDIIKEPFTVYWSRILNRPCWKLFEGPLSKGLGLTLHERIHKYLREWEKHNVNK